MKPITILRRKAKRGYQGQPAATIAAYGPTDKKATKLAVGIILAEGDGPAHLKRWYSESKDARYDPAILQEVLDYIESHKVKSVAMTELLLGCPHEEGKEYPTGVPCPMCPFWEGRDRWAATHGRYGAEGQL